MTDNSLSVCMIVKNEEKNLKRCLESIKNIADEIVIVDTGSTDNTIEIAKQYTTKVISHEWHNDFSEARNLSLDNATKAWILVLDADEALTKEDGRNLKIILKQNGKYEGFHLRLVNYVSDINIGDAIVLRVFKNNPKYRFTGRMHEQVIHTMSKCGAASKIAPTEVKILHYGYDPNKADILAKQKRNFDLLISYPEEERDGYFYYSLGNEYTRRGDYEKALETYKLSEEYPTTIGEFPVHLSYLAENVAKTLFAMGRFTEEIDKLHEYQEKYKNFRDLYFLECLAWSECFKYTEAKAALDNYINCTGGNYEYPSGNFEKQYDMEELLVKLNKNMVEHEEKLLSIVIIVDRYEFSILDTVKNMNEIADEIILIGTPRANMEIEKLRNIGAKAIEIKANGRKPLFIEACKNCTCKYILLMKPQEVMSVKNQRRLVEELKSGEVEFMYLNVTSNFTISTSQEFRVMKNSDEIKNFSSLEEYNKYVNYDNAKETTIQINNIYR